jgi:hypothetical protein
LDTEKRGRYVAAEREPQVRATGVPGRLTRREGMATRDRRYGPAGGITIGGIIVIVGIILMFIWSFWIGLIVALIGLLFFGGFARGRWY